MEVGSACEADLMAAMSRTVAYIQAHLDEALTPHRLADVACFSQPYFHRVFRAVLGESAMDHVRRLRLEKAAYLLKTSRQSIGRIALDAGYGAQEAFTRVFQAYFGIGPRTFRRSHASHLLPAASGVHYTPTGCTPVKRAVSPELLDDRGLCSAHRGLAATANDQLEQLLGIVTEFHFVRLPRPFRAVAPPPSEKYMSNMTQVDYEIDALLAEVEAAKQRLAALQRSRPREPVADYVLKDKEGKDIRLSELFGAMDDLIIVHNMGISCIYCTIWADGLTGLVPHFMDRAAFAVCSNDAPEVQRRFAEKRNWNFTMVSAVDSSFTGDMGFLDEGGPTPGISTFRREPDGSITRVGRSHLGAAYDCAVFPLIEMLQNGRNGWEPKYSYEKRP
jgi:AraC-like DNA-binding protein/predicted dithiol-disulfide oxidoreductase (DUF899 family)